MNDAIVSLESVDKRFATYAYNSERCCESARWRAGNGSSITATPRNGHSSS